MLACDQLRVFVVFSDSRHQIVIDAKPESKMKPQLNRSRVLSALIAIVIGVGISEPFIAVAESATHSPRIQVSWNDPAQLSEVKQNGSRSREKSSYWLGELQKYLVRKAGSRLVQGEHLEVRFTDVQLAGSYEPWRGPAFDTVRVVKDIYPPRIDLSFTLSDANGNVIASGDRKLRDMAFLSRGAVGDSDSLRYEKRLLDDWLSQEFVRKEAKSSAH